MMRGTYKFHSIAKALTLFLAASLLVGSSYGQDELQGPNPLEPVKTDSPRDTMETYLKAMDDYVRGKASGDKQLTSRLDDAVRCFNLSEVPTVSRREKGRNSAILLKEVMDRIIRVDPTKVEVSDGEKRWRLRHTEITIVLAEEGERVGEFLFSTDTVARLPEFYDRVRHLAYLPGLSGSGYRQDLGWSRVCRSGLSGKSSCSPIGSGSDCLLPFCSGWFSRPLPSMVLVCLSGLRRERDIAGTIKLLRRFERPAGVFAAGVLWLFSIHALKFEGNALSILNIAVQAVIGAGLIWAFYRLSDVLAEYLAGLTEKTESTLDDQLVPLVRKSLKIFVVIFGVLVVIQNMGVNVLSLLAGLGLGGLAFALAARDTCANLFGSIMILLDRPFQIGDWVIAGGGVEGTVEEIGFRVNSNSNLL